MEANHVELDHGSKDVLDESAVVEVEYQVRGVLWHFIQCLVINTYGHHHDHKEHTALTTRKQGCIE